MCSSEGCSGVCIELCLFLRGIHYFALCRSRTIVAAVAAVHGYQNVAVNFPTRIKNTGIITPARIVFATLILVLIFRGIACRARMEKSLPGTPARNLGRRVGRLT